MVDTILLDIVRELTSATDRYGEFHSTHEGYAVILEEMDELWEKIKQRRGDSAAAYGELIQVAAMCVRYAIDLVPDETIKTFRGRTHG